MAQKLKRQDDLISNRKEIDTPLGRGTVLGINPEGDLICIMHPRPKAEQDSTHGPCFTKWWVWDGEKITGEFAP